MDAWLQKNPALVNDIGPGPSTLLSFVQDPAGVEYLLKHEADPLRVYIMPDGEANTPLKCAAFRGQFESMKLMMKHSRIESDIFFASLTGDIAQVEHELMARPALARAFTPPNHALGAGLTALHLAAQAGQAEIIALLLDRDADVNAASAAYHAITPLLFCIKRGPRAMLDPLPSLEQMKQHVGVYRLLTEVPQLLLDHDADPLRRDNQHHRDALAWALADHDDETDRSALVELLRAHLQTT